MSNTDWVKCEDRLPELGDYSVLAFWSANGGMDMVHVTDYFGEMRNGFDDAGKPKMTAWYLQYGITHWHPMPEAPEAA